MAKKRKFLFGFDRQNVRFFFKSGYLDQEIQKAMNPDTLHPSPTARTTAAPCLPLQAVAWIDLDKCALCPRPQTHVFAGAEYAIFIFPMP